MPSYPTVTLDTTLTDLYKRAGPTYGNKKIGQVLSGASSVVNLTEQFPRNQKYIYQEGTFVGLSIDEADEDNIEFSRSAATKYLALVSQREAFIAGQATFYFFSINASAEQIEHDRHEFESTLSILADDQRPDLSLASGPENISLKENNVDALSCKVIIDSLDKYPFVTDLDTRYFLNTKEALAGSGLPTPPCDIIPLDGSCPGAVACCDECAAGKTLFISSKCTDIRSKWLAQSESAVTQAVKHRTLPFVVKSTQTFGGAGTWLVNTEQDRDTAIADLTGSFLRKLFSLVTAQNTHLRPGSILLSDMIQDPISNVGLTMFVREDGSLEILGVSEQIMDGSSWTGSTITYSKQPALIKKFETIAAKIAAWVHRYGYIGPVGADVLETPDEQLHIVDLNVRTSGSMCLPVLSGHFTLRGFDCVTTSNILVKKSCAEFMQVWETLFESGQAVILGWYQDRHTGISLGNIVVGEKDEVSLQDLLQKIQDSTDNVRL